MKPPIGFKFITQPYEFQYEAFVYGIENPNAGLLYDLGLGKTKIAIDIMRYRIQKGQVKRILVACPTSVMYNWNKEVKKHSEYSAMVLHGNRHERLQRFQQLNHQFYIINYEALHLFFKEIQQLNPHAFIMDESARYIKNPLAKRTKAAMVLSSKIPYKLILTATPIANRPLDLWSQFYCLDGGQTFGPNYYIYRNKYFNKISFGGKFFKWDFKKQFYNVINTKIFSRCIRKTKDECLDLPERIFNTIVMEMDYDLKEIYEHVQDEVLAAIKTSEGSAQFEMNSILTKLLRLQQITSGFTKDEVTNTEKTLSNTQKLDALIEHLELIVDAGESAVVWCRFIHTIEMIKQRLKQRGIRCSTMSGRTKDKYERWKGYQKDPNIPIFIAQVDSGGIGIELFKHNSTAKHQHMLFYENTWSLDVRQQAEGRIHRIGQTARCVYTDFVMKHTIDERILKSLKANKQVADLILTNGVEGWLKDEDDETL